MVTDGQEAVSTAERIRIGAAKAVDEHGIGPMTVQNVLVAAGVSRRTFYKHYSGKEDVLCALYAWFTAQLASRVEAAVEGTSDPLGKVTGAIDAYLDHLETDRPVLWQLQAEAVGSKTALSEERDRTLDQIVDIVGKGVTDTLGVNVDPLVYRALLVGLEGLAIHQRRHGTFDRDRIRAVAVPIFSNTLAAARYLPTDPASSKS